MNGQATGDGAFSDSERPTLVSLAKAMISVVVLGTVLFLCAGRVDWPTGWVFVGFAVVSTVIVSHLMDPELLRERTQTHQEGVKQWDLPLALFMGRIGPIAILAVAGFDVRFHWSPALALAAPIAGVTLLVLGYALSDWAVMANRFFAPVVRIQTERGHAVIQTGPYRWLRHPGYAGAALVYLATPLMLSSVWALIPAVLTIGVIIVRTALEDRTLLQELAGYAGYAARVPRRLVPGVW